MRRGKSGVDRAWVKVGEPNEWRVRAHLIWCIANGPLPDGWVVHHRDRNPLNDYIGNLQGMSRSDHIAEHRDELEAAR